MAPVNRRAQARTATPATRQSSGLRGAAAIERMHEEEQKAIARKEAAEMNMNMPFRFFCMPGETREIVVIDDKPDWFRSEHNLKNTRTGRYDIYCACLAEFTNCPPCKETDRPPYYGMFLTCIDLTPYTNKDGKEIPWSKKLLVVKSQQQKKFLRLYERHGTLRGMVLTMTRDGQKDAQIGNDIEFVEFMEEDELLAYETTVEYEQAGKKKSRDIIGHEVFDYDELFPMPTEQQLRAVVGGRPDHGSREEENQALGRRTTRRTTDDWGQDDDAPARPAARSARPARPAARAAARDETPDEEVLEEDVEDATPARRGVPARRAAPAAPTRRAPAARRAVQDDPEEEVPEVEEETPRRSATSLAEQRRKLRRAG